jgi:hypothetical protein
MPREDAPREQIDELLDKSLVAVNALAGLPAAGSLGTPKNTVT